MTAEQRSAFAYATRAGGKLRVITGGRWDEITVTLTTLQA
jgi:hypothetical protein